LKIRLNNISHLHLGPPSFHFFPSGYSTKTLSAFLFGHIRVTCPVNSILFAVIALLVLSDTLCRSVYRPGDVAIHKIKSILILFSHVPLFQMLYIDVSESNLKKKQKVVTTL